MGTEPTPLAVIVSSDRPTTLILVGELDASTVVSARAAFESLPDGERSIDATGVTFIGARGLGVLVELTAESERAGHVLVISPADVVRRLAAITGTDQVLNLV